MNRIPVQFQRIENDHAITKEGDADFLYCLQQGLLLALKEQGRLNEMQYRQAESTLAQQRRKEQLHSL